MMERERDEVTGEPAAVGTAEAALRSFSALLALATLWVFFLLVREMVGERTARISAVILCFSPFFIYYGQEARMYTLLAFLTVLGTLWLLRWSRRGGSGLLVGYGLVALLGVYTHVFYIFLIAAHLAFLLLRDRRLSRRVWHLVGVQATAGVFFAPWAALILSGGPGSQDWKGTEHVIFGVPYTLLRFSLGYSEVLANVGWKESVSTLLAEHAAILATAGLNDPRVSYWEPAKWVARLRATASGDARLLLYTDLQAGHRGQAGRFRRQRELAREYAFVCDVLELER
jgi:hypothetical protein